MIELYGIEHGERTPIEDYVTIDNFIEPSPELLTRLESLPRGTRVGIEYHPLAYRKTIVSGQRFVVDSPAIITGEAFYELLTNLF